MFYYLYQITNLVNGKIYVGVHKTKSLDDGYMGSGKVLNRSIQKHGIENFNKVILETFENAEAMYAREKEIVTEEFLLREDTYNLRRGGNGGFDYINKVGKNVLLNEQRIKDPSMQQRSNIAAAKRQKELMSDPKYRRKVSNKLSNALKGQQSWLGKKHTEETKIKMSKSHLGKHEGNMNSQFGSCWITKDGISKKIKKEELEGWISNNWHKGRK